jgi:DNA-directed RNA polymerase subunit K/omega
MKKNNETVAEKKLVQSNPGVETRSVESLRAKTGNTYETVMVLAKRANQISSKTKEELHNKLADFASTVDNLEEVHENREQIEISKFYEKLPHPTLIATQEYTEGKVYSRNPKREQ